MTDEPDLCDDEGCPQHGTPHVCLEIGDLVRRLSLAEVASCTCVTKTPEVRFHDPGCHYRLFREAVSTIQVLRKVPQ